MIKQGQVGQYGATCGHMDRKTNALLTERPTDRPTQPVLEVRRRT